MLTVGYLLGAVEEAIARVLPARKVYATQAGVWPLAAPCLLEDDESAYSRIACECIARMEKRANMLRFALTDQALLAALPALPGTESGAGLTDKLFSGDFPLAGRYEPLALTWARANILLRGKPVGTPSLTEPSRTLLWLSAQAIDVKSLLAGTKCERAMRGLVLKKAEGTLGAIRYGHMALEKVLLQALTYKNLTGGKHGD